MTQTFLMQPAGQSKTNPSPPTGTRLVSVAQLRTEGLAGMTIRWRRDWPLSFIDQSLSRVEQAGKAATLIVCSGDRSNPATESQLATWERLWAKLGDKYADVPRLTHIHCSGCTPQGKSEEPHWEDVDARVYDGLTRMVDAVARAFPRQNIIQAISLKDPPAMRGLIDHGISVARGRFIAKHNAWSAKMSVDAGQNELLVYAAKHGADIAVEQLCDSTEARYGGTWKQGVAKLASVEKRAGKACVYRGVYFKDLPRIGT